MTGIDWVIAFICLVSTLISIFRGFIKEVLSLTAWILAIWIATTFNVEAGAFLTQKFGIPVELFRKGSGFTVLFVGSLFTFAIINHFINKAVSGAPIKVVDRILGMAHCIYTAAI